MVVYGIVVMDDEQIGMWKIVDGHRMELNLEPEQMPAIEALVADSGLVLSFLVDPDIPVKEVRKKFNADQFGSSRHVRD